MRASSAASVLVALCALVPCPTSGQDFRIVHGFDNPPAYPVGLTVGPDAHLYGVTPRGGTDDRGTVFRVEQDGSVTVIASIPEGSAQSPVAGLTRVGDWLYGTGPGQAPYPVAHGSVFRVSLNGQVEILHEFDGTGGSRPQSQLTLGSDRLLYGTTPYGGAAGKGTLYRLDPDGNGFEVLHAFEGAGQGEEPGTTVVEGEPGVFYGTTPKGGSGSTWNGILYRFDTATRTFTVLHSFSGGTGTSVSGELLWYDEQLWGTTVTGGGSSTCGSVFRRTAAGAIETLHAFSCTANESGPRGRLVVGPDGALWGTTAGYLSSGGTVFRLATGPVPSVSTVHSFSAFGDNPSGGLVAWGGMLWGVVAGAGTSSYNNLGSVFQVEPEAPLQTVHSFRSGGGREVLSLTEDEGGAWYGTTGRGGALGLGTVFRTAPDGSATTVHEFEDTLSGSQPHSYVTRATDGNLYGVRDVGGQFGRGTLFQLLPSGPRTDMHHFNGVWGDTDGRNPSVAPTEGRDGMLYGMTPTGGAASWGTAYRIGKDGSGYQKLFDLNGVGTGSESSRRLLEASDNWFYGVAPLNGWNGYSAGYGTVFRFRPGGAFQVVHQFTGYTGPVSSYSPQGEIVEVSPGRFFGVAQGGTTGQGVLYEVAKGEAPTAPTEFRVLFSFGADPALGTYPIGGLARGADGLVYGTAYKGGTSDKGVVFRLRPDGTGLESLHSFSGADGKYPNGLQTGQDGDLYGFTALGGPRGGGAVYRLCLPPGVVAGGTYSVPEGGSVAVAASQAGSKRVSFDWDFDLDGVPDAEGAEVVFSAQGLDGPSTHELRARATDDCGLTGEAPVAVQVENVAPAVDAGPDVSLGLGAALATAGTFDDPGADTWTATVDYGDGAGPQPLALSGRSFALSHRYSGSGTYTVTVRVTDDDGGTGADTLLVTTRSVESSIGDLITRVRELVDDGSLRRGQAASLIAELQLALWFLQFPNGDAIAAVMLDLFVQEVELYMRTGVLSAAEGGPLVAGARDIIAELRRP
jgi:uncharacterized repeat protein (TIGR03803 family)